jgi:hypothetical protein
MARNSVQFQKGLSEAAFDELYGTEPKCRAAVIAWRWPDGFACPACGGAAHCEVKTRGLLQCRRTAPCRSRPRPTSTTSSPRGDLLAARLAAADRKARGGLLPQVTLGDNISGREVLAAAMVWLRSRAA